MGYRVGYRCGRTARIPVDPRGRGLRAGHAGYFALFTLCSSEHGETALDDAYRLTPTRASRKLAALEFIKRYWAARGASPSYSEIANALGITKKDVHRIVHELDECGLVILTDRPARKIDLPEPSAHFSIGDALVLLQREGFTIIGDGGDPDRPVTLAGLPLVAELDQYFAPDDGVRRDVARKSS